MPASPGALQQLTFPGLALPVVLRQAPEVADGLQRVINGWKPSIRTISGGKSPALARVTRDATGFTLGSVFLDAPMRQLSAASAVCGVVADLAQFYVEERPGFHAIHGGAFRFNRRLIAVAGPARSGKSTLIARLSAEPGVQILCDDVLPVSPEGLGIGLGIAPRLRLPLPASASGKFRMHVAAHVALRDERYAYIAPPSLSAHGTSAPLEVLIVLSRRDGRPAALHRLDGAGAAHHLLRQNLSDPVGARSAFDGMAGLAARLRAFQLVYSNLEDAVALLRRAFGGAVLPDPDVDTRPPPSSDEAAAAPSFPPADLGSIWRRNPRAAVRRVRNELLLWHAGEQTTFHLNTIAAAVWAMLSEPETGMNIADALIAAFRQESPARITKDLRQLLAGMAAAQLITETKAP